jgi:hypothetical protein
MLENSPAWLHTVDRIGGRLENGSYNALKNTFELR